MPLKGAEKAGLQVRIAHAHNIWIVRDYKWPLKMFCAAAARRRHPPVGLRPGCGHLLLWQSGLGAPGTDHSQRHRAGDLPLLSPAVRAEMRARYGLEDRVVLGHVGRFDVRKNHERLLEIFAAFFAAGARAIVVLIGTGRLEQAVRAQAQTLGITDHILFAGLQNNVAGWYQMMDLFVMPSRFEGLPVVGDRGASRRAGVRIFGRSAGGGAAFFPCHPDPAFRQQCRLGSRLAADAPPAPATALLVQN